MSVSHNQNYEFVDVSRIHRTQRKFNNAYTVVYYEF